MSSVTWNNKRIVINHNSDGRDWVLTVYKQQAYGPYLAYNCMATYLSTRKPGNVVCGSLVFGFNQEADTPEVAVQLCINQIERGDFIR